MTKEKKVKKIFRGIVVSDKMKKTLVVKVERMKLHPKYQKRYKISRHFKVHDEQEKYKIGETVGFVECRPLSKEKRWRVLYK